MKYNTIIKNILKEKDMSMYALNQKIGYKSNNTVAARLIRKEITISILLEMLDGLDYEIIVRPKDTYVQRSEEFRLDGVDHDGEDVAVLQK